MGSGQDGEIAEAARDPDCETTSTLRAVFRRFLAPLGFAKQGKRQKPCTAFNFAITVPRRSCSSLPTCQPFCFGEAFANAHSHVHCDPARVAIRLPNLTPRPSDRVTLWEDPH